MGHCEDTSIKGLNSVSFCFRHSPKSQVRLKHRSTQYFLCWKLKKQGKQRDVLRVLESNDYSHVLCCEKMEVTGMSLLFLLDVTFVCIFSC